MVLMFPSHMFSKVILFQVPAYILIFNYFMCFLVNTLLD